MTTIIKNIIHAELIRTKNEYRFYWFDYLMTHINFLLLLSGLFFIAISNSEKVDENVIIKFLFGTMIWYFSYGIITSSARVLSEEVQQETINQLLATKANIYIVLLCRQGLQLLISFVFVILFFILSMTHPDVSIDLGYIMQNLFNMTLLFSLCSFGLFGIGLSIAGLAFIFRKVSSFAILMNYIFLFFTGSLIPFETFPGWLKKVLYLIPLTHTNIAFENTLRSKDPTKAILILSILSTAYFAGGVFMFRHFLRRKKFG